MHTSPAQRMFARRTRTLLPMLPALLQTDPAAQRDAPEQLKRRKEKQAWLYNRTSKKLGTLQPGDVVRFKKPNTSNDSLTWTLARVKKTSGIRSYIIESGGSLYRRNRRQLRNTPEHYKDVAPYAQQNEPDNTTKRQQCSDNQNAQQRGQDETFPQRSVSPDGTFPQRSIPPVDTSPQRIIPTTVVQPTSNVTPSVRYGPRGATVARSGRTVKLPVKFKDYEMSNS